MAVYTIYDAILGSLTLRQVTDASVMGDGEVMNALLSNGTLAELFAGRKDVRARFTTEDVAGVCGVADIATKGLAISSGTITIPLQKRANFGTFEAGSTHYALTGANALVIPQSFSASENGNATAALDVIFASTDGTTAPVTESSTAALGSTQHSSLYSLGPVSINGTPIDCPVNLTINTGITVRQQYCKGNIFPVEIYLTPPITPSIEISGPGVHQLLGSVGGWVAGTALVAYFRKRSTTGFVADGVAEHIKFSFADGLIRSSVSGSQGQDASKSITFFGESLVVTAASAIT